MLTFEKSIESEYSFFSNPMIFPISFMLEAPTDLIVSLQIFFVSSSFNCFGKKASIILITKKDICQEDIDISDLHDNLISISISSVSGDNINKAINSIYTLLEEN